MITGWIKLRRYDPLALYTEDGAPVYVSVDQIQAVYEETDPDNEGAIFTVLDMITGEIKVDDPIAEVMQKIKLARPVRS